MNVARPSDGLLSANQTLALLELLKRHPAGQQREKLLRDLAALHPAIWSKGRNTIALLIDFKILSERDGFVSLTDIPVEDDNWVRVIGRIVADVLAKRLSSGSSSCLQRNGDNGIWLDTLLLPGVAEGLPLWVVEFSVATRERVSSRFWLITKEYENLFLAAARIANKRVVRRIMTLVDLKAKQDRDAEHGLAAEEWVLAFERRRLSGHPLVDQIRRISDDDVAAGYDIVSFSGDSVLQHDLFIEVKSYAGAKRFFWTRTEIEVAKALGERYCLYLINRAEMHAREYQPQIIAGPYAALFQSQGSGWTISPTTFECVAPAN